MQKILIWAAIILSGCLFACAKTDKNPDSYKVKYKNELAAARNLLEDSRSKEVFDAVVRHYSSLNINDKSWHVTWHPEFKLPEPNGIEQYFHPLIPISPGDTVIDAGAGITEPPSFVLFAQAAGDNGKVIGFEPNPFEFKMLVNEISRRGLKNAEAYQLGLWHKPDTLTLTLMGQASSLLSVKPAGETAKVETIKVEVVKLDDFVKEYKIDKVDFIKMDIEGAEKEALLGAENVLREHKPKLVLSAYHLPKDLFAIILLLDSFNLGYKFWFEVHADPYNEIVIYAKVDKSE